MFHIYAIQYIFKLYSFCLLIAFLYLFSVQFLILFPLLVVNCRSHQSQLISFAKMQRTSQLCLPFAGSYSDLGKGNILLRALVQRLEALGLVWTLPLLTRAKSLDLFEPVVFICEMGMLRRPLCISVLLRRSIQEQCANTLKNVKYDKNFRNDLVFCIQF